MEIACFPQREAGGVREEIWKEEEAPQEVRRDHGLFWL